MGLTTKYFTKALRLKNFLKKKLIKRVQLIILFLSSFENRSIFIFSKHLTSILFWQVVRNFWFEILYFGSHKNKAQKYKVLKSNRLGRPKIQMHICSKLVTLTRPVLQTFEFPLSIDNGVIVPHLSLPCVNSDKQSNNKWYLQVGQFIKNLWLFWLIAKF